VGAVDEDVVGDPAVARWGERLGEKLPLGVPVVELLRDVLFVENLLVLKHVPTGRMGEYKNRCVISDSELRGFVTGGGVSAG